MRHPRESQLALYAGGDLGWAERWNVRRHVNGCPDCNRAVSAYSDARQQVMEGSKELPSDINWNRLAQEMTGNIRVGLAAGEAIAGFDKVGNSGRPRAFRWNAGWTLACASAVFTLAFWLNIPTEQSKHLVSWFDRVRAERTNKPARIQAAVSDEIVLEASHSSIQVRENGRSLALLHPHSDGVTISVSMPGSAGARYVDADTGQVTMNRVYYAEQ